MDFAAYKPTISGAVELHLLPSASLAMILPDSSPLEMLVSNIFGGNVVGRRSDTRSSPEHDDDAVSLQLQGSSVAAFDDVM